VLQCLKADDLLSSFGASRAHSRLSVENFMHVCPILISQLDSHVCCGHDEQDHHHHHHHGEDTPTWKSSPATGMLSDLISYIVARHISDITY